MFSPSSYEGAESEYDDISPLNSAYRPTNFPSSLPKLTFTLDNNGSTTQGKTDNDPKVKSIVPGLKFNKLEEALKNVKKPSPEKIPNSEDMVSDLDSQTYDDDQILSFSGPRENVEVKQNKEPLVSLALSKQIYHIVLIIILDKIAPRKELASNFGELKEKFGSVEHMNDAKESDIKRIKREFYSEQCNEVIEVRITFGLYLNH